MTVTPHKTKLIQPNDNLFKIITETIETIPEKSVLAIASKAFSFAEGCLGKKKNRIPKNKSTN